MARQKTRLVCFGEISKIDAIANKTALTLQKVEEKAEIKNPKFAFYSWDIILDD